MTTNQKVEVSREIRQWIGIGLSALGIAYYVNPEGTKKTLTDFKNKAKDILTPKKD